MADGGENEVKQGHHSIRMNIFYLLLFYELVLSLLVLSFISLKFY